MLVDSSISVVGLGYLVATHPTEASIAKYSFHVALARDVHETFNAETETRHETQVSETETRPRH